MFAMVVEYASSNQFSDVAYVIHGITNSHMQKMLILSNRVKWEGAFVWTTTNCLNLMPKLTKNDMTRATLGTLANNAIVSLMSK
jgi:hypothetical protein